MDKENTGGASPSPTLNEYNGDMMEMDKEKELPKRKPTRLKNFDYSSAGAYFVTICIRDRMNILSEIVKTDLTATDKTNGLSVGEGLE